MFHYLLMVGLLAAVTNARPSDLLIADDGFGFDFFSRTNQGNVTMPTNIKEAASMGWKLTERSDGHPCRENLGIEYTEGNSTQTKERPVSLFFSAKTGALTAFAVRAWFSDDSFYNPQWWTEPPFGAIDNERWITVNTRNPGEACATSSSKVGEPMLGTRLILNSLMDNNMSIPVTVPTDPTGPWISGACQLGMSRHWGFPLDGSDLYGSDHGTHVLPVVPMYAVPASGNGKVTALAFFTTEGQVVNKDGGVWDATGTGEQLCEGNFCIDASKCEYGEGNSVFHIFFINPSAPEAQCDTDPPSCPSVY